MRKMLVAVDSSEHSQKVAEEASKLAASLGTEVTLMTVIEEFSRISGLAEIPWSEMEKIDRNRKETLEQFLQKLAEQFRKKGVEAEIKLATGHPGQVICEMAKNGGYSYIVLGNRGMGGFARLLLGSVSNQVAHCAEQNVIIIK